MLNSSSDSKAVSVTVCRFARFSAYKAVFIALYKPVGFSASKAVFIAQCAFPRFSAYKTVCITEFSAFKAVYITLCKFPRPTAYSAVDVGNRSASSLPVQILLLSSPLGQY